jgi:hypothetical protein
MTHGLRVNRAVLLATGAVLLLVALVAVVAWRLDEPRRNLEAARARWLAAPVEHYRLVVRMQGWGGCFQDAEVRNERVVSIASNSCRYYSPRTVSSLFMETERFLRGPEVGSSCRRGIAGRDCACYVPYKVVAEYDPERGYPSTLQVIVNLYAPNRTHLHYWRYLLNHGREPACGGPIEPAGRHLVIELFEPLP